MSDHMSWEAGFAAEVVQRAVADGLVERAADEVRLTERGSRRSAAGCGTLGVR